MDKLIAVEFSPLDSKAKFHPLFGCVGETLESLYNRAKSTNGSVPVRFPLLAPNARMGICMNDRDLLDPIQLTLEGLQLNVNDLFISDRTPVSLFTRKNITTITTISLKNLFESKQYLATRSKKCFINILLPLLANSYTRSWVWKHEWIRDTVPVSLFMEARLYGIDVAISTYDSNKFDGIALEITTRSCCSTPPRNRYRCDTYLFSNFIEYISYLDGAPIERESLGEIWLHSLSRRYSKVSSAKQVTKWRKDTNTMAIAQKEKLKIKLAAAVINRG